MNKKIFLPMLFFSQCVKSEQSAEAYFVPPEPNKHSLDFSLPTVVEQKKNPVNLLPESIEQTDFLRKIYKVQKNPMFLEYKFTQAGWPMIDLFKAIGSLQIDVWYGSCRAIANATKSCLYVRSSALNNILGALSAFVVPHLEKLKGAGDEALLETKIEKLISLALHDGKLSSMDSLTKSLAKDIVVACNESKAEPIAQYLGMIKELLYNYVDSIIARTTWEPSDYSTAWDSLLTAANYLYQMPTVLETCDKLDNLIISLIHSFTRFLDFNCEELPLAFLKSIRESIIQKEAFFIAEPESDDFVITKKDFFLNKIDECIAKKKQQETKPWQENVDKMAMSFKDKPVITTGLPKLFENV